MKEPVLVIMAAGMGSRFGGLKQLPAVDKEGHSIIDFSMYDAWKAGGFCCSGGADEARGHRARDRLRKGRH